jgi:hypothetical protein
MVTRAPTYTDTYTPVTYTTSYTPTEEEAWRMKRGALSKKLHTEHDLIATETTAAYTNTKTDFTSVNAQLKGIAAAISDGIQVSAATLRKGAILEYAFSFTNPIGQKIIVRDVVVCINTAGGTANARLALSVATVAGVAGRATRAARLINYEGGASGYNVISSGDSGMLLNYATIYSCASPHGFTVITMPTLMDASSGTGNRKYLNGRIVAANAGSLAGTAYIFWMKPIAGS